MARLQVMQQRRNADLIVILKVAIPIDGEVDYCQESVCVHCVQFTSLIDSLIAKAKINAKRA
jgi:hypothetical protein